MFAGHFGLAAAVKAKSPEVPLWALMLSTQLLDVVFVPLFLTGVETIEPVGDGYGEHLIHADFSHSLVGALLIALIAGLVARLLWGKRGALVIASLAFSHWLLDLLVHRSDLPILPGNLLNLPLLGFGFWKFPIVSIVMEAALIIIGFLLYYRSIVPGTTGKRKVLAITASGILGVLLILSLISDVLGIEL